MAIFLHWVGQVDDDDDTHLLYVEFGYTHVHLHIARTRREDGAVNDWVPPKHRDPYYDDDEKAYGRNRAAPTTRKRFASIYPATYQDNVEISIYRPLRPQR